MVSDIGRPRCLVDLRVIAAAARKDEVHSAVQAANVCQATFIAELLVALQREQPPAR
jgi:hypothetical protein